MKSNQEFTDQSGFSSPRLQRLTAALQGYVEREEIAGIVALIYRHGTLAYAATIGWQDKEARLPMKRETLFRLASMTKPIIATAVLMLVEEGKLRLDDPVDAWLPELATPVMLRQPDGPLNETAPSPRSITVSDLLTYRAGIGLSMRGEQTPYEQTVATLLHAPFAPWIIGITTMPPEQFAPWITSKKRQAEGTLLDSDSWLERVGQVPLRYEPGTHLLYHVPFDILGVLVARVAHQALGTFLRERVFVPLGMTDTDFAVPNAQRHRLAVLYAPTSQGLIVTDHPNTSDWAHAPLFSSGAGGLVSTADDYLRFGRMLLQQGQLDGVRLLSRKSVEAMTTDWLTTEQRIHSLFGPSEGIGYGVRIRMKPTVLAPGIGSFTWNGVLGTAWVADPQEDLVATYMLQLSGGDVFQRLQQDFWTLLYQAIDD